MIILGVAPEKERMVIGSVAATDLVGRFPNVFAEAIGQIPKACHHIRLKHNATPFAIRRSRQIPLAMKAGVIKEQEKMIADDVIEPVEPSDWVHPMIALRKPNGSFRIINDLRRLNSEIIVEKFNMPTVDELMAKMANAKFFSKLDLRSAYFHLTLAPANRHLTAFLTPLGLMQYKRLPMGLSFSAAAWQKLIEHCLAGEEGAVVYMDDICIFGESKESHNRSLLKVMQRLDDSNLRVNWAECRTLPEKLNFLGVIMSDEGIHPCDEKIRAIAEAPVPVNS